MDMSKLHESIFIYDPHDIATTLLMDQSQFTYAGEKPDFNKTEIIDCLYWIKAATENDKNRDMWRQFYNLLAAVNYESIIPF